MKVYGRILKAQECRPYSVMLDTHCTFNPCDLNSPNQAQLEVTLHVPIHLASEYYIGREFELEITPQ